MNVSPTSQIEDPLQLPRPSLAPPCTMGDLAVQLDQQSLRFNSHAPPDNHNHISTNTTSSTSPSDEYKSSSRPTYSRVAASVLRMQRQSSSRMQCSPSHVRDISKLVRMVQAQEQCTVNDPSSRPSSPSSASTACTASGDDEGIDMDYDIPARSIDALVGTSQWRAGERRDSCIRVTRPVRMRKRNRENGVSKRSPS